MGGRIRQRSSTAIGVLETKKNRSESHSEGAAILFRQSAFARVWEFVGQLPRGRVITYGGVAAAIGLGRGARVVGYAMRASPDGLPWHRVLAKKAPNKACISIKDPIGASLQKHLLEKEGVFFDECDQVDLRQFGIDV